MKLKVLTFQYCYCILKEIYRTKDEKYIRDILIKDFIRVIRVFRMNPLHTFIFIFYHSLYFNQITK